MASVETNRQIWNNDYNWSSQGNEWSKAWGDPNAQWNWCLLPRINAFVPCRAVLEIAPGFGRWTQFLKDVAEHCLVVDLAPACIEACKKRFAASTNISYFVNDGRSLEAIPDNAIDFVFSFDSLVHADPDCIAAYLFQLAKKLTPDGVGFIHHSNLGEHQSYINEAAKIPPEFKNALIACGVIDNCHFRAHGMTASLFEQICNECGLQCIGQEKFPWYGNKLPIDCISVFTRKGSRWARDNSVIVNDQFMKEAEKMGILSKLYAQRS